MRGDEEAPAARAALPNHQLRHHRTSMTEEGRNHPRHSTATPASLSHTIQVKVDDSPDSGVPSDELTPETSPENRSSVSPESWVHQMPYYANLPPSFRGNPGSAIKLSAATPVMIASAMSYPLRPSEETPMDVVANETSGSVQSSVNNQRNPATYAYKCSFCSFSAIDNGLFHQHLSTHFRDLVSQGDSVDHAPVHDQEPNYKSAAASESFSDHEKSPKTSGGKGKSKGRGKKMWGCKRCGLTFSSTRESWEHRQVHVRPDKQLHCPKCPFVTPFKHHLEYHISNHYGIKPFECAKCEYTCVSKSMLNSHLKSHSTVYQFNCKDCPYRTKYCHSFKLHLRKERHEAGWVLHPDGTPNPDFVLDINGTRRGPKRKNVEIKIKTSTPLVSPACSVTSDGYAAGPSNSCRSGSEENTPGQDVTLPQLSPFRAGPSNVIGAMQVPSSHAHEEGIPAGYPNQHPLIDPNGMSLIMAYRFDELVKAGFPLASYEITDENQFEHFRSRLIAQALAMDPIRAAATGAAAMNSAFSPEMLPEPSTPRPLDLSTQDTAESLPPHMETLKIVEQSVADGFDSSGHGEWTSHGETSERLAPGTPRLSSSTSRRKGKAIKFVRPVVKVESVSEDEEDVVECGVPDSKAAVKNDFSCQYCGISFDNEFMHHVHMGQHSFDDPFKCNQCGHKCNDKLSFFMHITKTKH